VNARAVYVMVGGFLGAGKTTAVARLARHLAGRGLSVGLITNDQSTGLVDTRLLRTTGFPVEEIGGGCFCCRFRSLEEAVARLSADTRPDVFVAEPVGSCTDLVATVSYPLRRIYGDRYRVAPLSVLVDPLRAARILGLNAGTSFSPKVRYVYEKQLEEAELIVVNKLDLIDADLRARLVRELERRFARASVLCVSARDGLGLEPWFERLLAGEHAGPTLAIDYGRYAEGEALLGWLNATLSVAARAPFDAGEFLGALAAELRARLVAGGAEIAHLKLTLDPFLAGGSVAALSMVANDRSADLREALLDRVDGGGLVVNLRAEADPELLWRAFQEVLAWGSERGFTFTLEHAERFRPAAPVPVHRDTVAAGIP